MKTKMVCPACGGQVKISPPCNAWCMDCDWEKDNSQDQQEGLRNMTKKYTVWFRQANATMIEVKAECPASARRKATNQWKRENSPEVEAIEVSE